MDPTPPPPPTTPRAAGPVATAASWSPGAERALVVVFTAAVFLSAFLLFLIQPMFSRMVLPLLGGTPAVWNTCMLFFQAALLGGYLYAHASTRWLGSRRQSAAHVVLLAAAALALPIAVGSRAPEGGAAPIPWLLGLMAVTVGLPFFVLSATGPMLQKWFADAGHRDARDPYFLYAASNLGSMLALLGYPVLVEPNLRLGGQSWMWAGGYGLLGLLLAGCAVFVWKAPRPAAASADVGTSAPTTEDGRVVEEVVVTWRERARWVMLAFVPSSLLLSLTAFLTTDITPAPFLWVVPLALFLLTFTLSFARRPPLPHRWMLVLQAFAVAAVTVHLVFGLTRDPVIVIGVHLLAFFATAMVCHGELSRRRPGVSHLTEFFLWIAVGGVLGGIFNVLVAPFVFVRAEEYALVIALGCLLRPRPQGGWRLRKWMEVALVALFAVEVALLTSARSIGMESLPEWVSALLAAVLCVGFSRWPTRMTMVVGTFLFLRVMSDLRRDDVLLAERSFFGRATVRSVPFDGGFHALYHGSTLHGAQSLVPARRREPLTYYVRQGPFGAVHSSLARPLGSRRVAAVGLGTGTLAAYGERGDEWTFFEIDPKIEALARDTTLFSYLADSRAKIRVVLGDARLSLAEEPDGIYDLIVLDAFSSDAVPVHLLTRDALEMYVRKLAPHGIVVYHLSNRYLDLERVVSAIVKDRGLAARVGRMPQAGERFEAASTWAAVARTEADLGPLTADVRWSPLKPARIPAWTDDFSNLFAVLGRS